MEVQANKATLIRVNPKSMSMSKALSLLNVPSMSIQKDCKDLYQQVENSRIKAPLWIQDRHCLRVYRNLYPEPNQTVEAMGDASATAIRVPKVSKFYELPCLEANYVKISESYRTSH